MEQRNALPVGTQLGGYEILAVLGRGGFGITYRAYDRSRVYCGGYDENGNYVPCPDSDSNSLLGRAQQQYQDLKDSFEKISVLTRIPTIGIRSLPKDTQNSGTSGSNGGLS